jgi:hypothetical protein
MLYCFGIETSAHFFGRDLLRDFEIDPFTILMIATCYF